MRPIALRMKHSGAIGWRCIGYALLASALVGTLHQFRPMLRWAKQPRTVPLSMLGGDVSSHRVELAGRLVAPPDVPVRGDVLQLFWNARASAHFSAPLDEALVLACGEAAGGVEPLVRVEGGGAAGRLLHVPAGWGAHLLALKNPAEELALEFVNDEVLGEQDRNVYLARSVLRMISTAPQARGGRLQFETIAGLEASFQFAVPAEGQTRLHLLAAQIADGDAPLVQIQAQPEGRPAAVLYSGPMRAGQILLLPLEQAEGNVRISVQTRPASGSCAAAPPRIHWSEVAVLHTMGVQLAPLVWLAAIAWLGACLAFRATVATLMVRLLVLAAAVAGLTAFEPGFFTIDDLSYFHAAKAMAEECAFSLNNGYDQFPSRELVPERMLLKDGEIIPIGAPAYPVLAAPFYRLFGLNGLYYLNLAAFCAMAALLYRTGQSVLRSDWAALASVVVLLAATFGGEYALGLWPHALGAALAFASLALLLAPTARPAGALAAGLLAALAMGVRVQVVLPVTWQLGVLLLLARGRRRELLPYTAGLLAMGACLTAVSWMRSSHASPLSYGYAAPTDDRYSGPFPVLASLAMLAWGGVLLLIAWRRRVRGFLGLGLLSLALGIVVALLMPDGFYRHVLESAGSYARQILWLEDGSPRAFLRKGLFYSLPYLPLCIAATGLALRGRMDVRAAALLLGSCLTLFAFYTADGMDYGGFAANNRYFFKVLPHVSLLVVAVLQDVYSGASVRLRIAALACGASAAAAMLWTEAELLSMEAWRSRQALAWPASLALWTALASAVCVFLPGLARRAASRLAIAALVGASFASALATSWSDLHAARGWRHATFQQARAVAAVVSPDSLLVAYGGEAWQLGPIHALKPVWIANPLTDRYQDLTRLLQWAAESGKPTYLVHLWDTRWCRFLFENVEPLFELDRVDTEAHATLFVLGRPHVPPRPRPHGLDLTSHWSDWYVLRGFHAPDGTRRRWTGAEAEILLPLPSRKIVAIEMMISGARPPGDPAKLRVLVNGVPVGEALHSGEYGVREFSIPPELPLQLGQHATVRIESTTFRPVDLGLGSDDRPLGVIVEWVRVREAPPESAESLPAYTSLEPADPASEPYLYLGFHPAEAPDRRWTTGVAEVLVPVPEPPFGTFRLHLAGDRPPQFPARIRVLLDGQLLGEATHGGGSQSVEFAVPPGLLPQPGRVAVLRLETNAYKPSDYAPGSDARELGVILQRLELL